MQSQARNTLVNGSNAPLTGVSIVLVEDSIDNQEIFRFFLEAAGAQLEIAENGKIGVDLVLQVNPDIVLMDIQLPVMDGKTATTTLRNSGFKKPIVALTAHAFNEEKQACLAAGCDNQLSKPVSSSDLVKHIIETIAKGHAS